MGHGTAHRAGASIRQFPGQDPRLVVQKFLVNASVSSIRLPPLLICPFVSFLGLLQTLFFPVLLFELRVQCLHASPVIRQLIHGSLGGLIFLACVF